MILFNTNIAHKEKKVNYRKQIVAFSRKRIEQVKEQRRTHVSRGAAEFDK